MTPGSESVLLQVDVDPRINFAMQQNDVSVVKLVRIENTTLEPLRDIEVRIRSTPDFAAPWSARISAIPARSTHSLSAIDLKLAPAFLESLTERLRGQLQVEVVQGESVLKQLSQEVELLARDDWGGISSLPEILAAFVVPNHPSIERLLRAAGDLLEEWTGDPSLNGYQSKSPQRVYRIAAAIYAALRDLDLTYINPPASYQLDGQRVRLPERILDSKMGTCLDLALFAASCLEQVGLHPLVVLTKSHAFTGVWLIDECFPDPASDDGLRLRKRVELGEVLVFDPTAVTTRPALDFDRAKSVAVDNLAVLDDFHCVIDIQRSRISRIRPLPERVGASAQPSSEIETGTSHARPSAPDVSGVFVTPADASTRLGASAETPATRLDRWRSKLLDLSLRNRLLNFKDTKKTLPLLCSDLAALEDLLSTGTTFAVHERPGDLGDNDPRNAEAHQRRTGVDGREQALLHELKARRLRADATAQDLDRRLTEIYRAARLGIEEGDASALYLAIGFLAWYESDSSEQRLLAPLLLVPVKLQRGSIQQGFSLTKAEDDARFNVTLLELLRKDHGLTISGLDPLPEDESGVDVSKILHAVRHAVRDIPRWEVVADARIGLFSFAKFLMWRDLTERAGDLIKNPVVAHLVNRPNQKFGSGDPSPALDRLDDDCPPTQTYCPLPADSSQLTAVLAAAAGQSFVLEGPPGTGKSQTITNLIAHCLTEGKRVLFVSEKMAALEVVRRRLASIGLGRFCLELHSNTTQKREVVGQLEESLEGFGSGDEADWMRECRALAGLRSELNAYARALHQKRSTGETVFQATSRLIGLRDVPNVTLGWSPSDVPDADTLSVLRDTIDRLATAAGATGAVANHPWKEVRHEDWTPNWEEEVFTAVGRFERATETLQEAARQTSEHLSLHGEGWSLSDLEMIADLVAVLMDSPAPPPTIVVRPHWDEIQVQVGTWIEHGRARDLVRARLRTTFDDEIIRLNLDDLKQQLNRARTSWWPMSWWRRRPVLAALASVAKNGARPRPAELVAILEQAIKYRDEQLRLDAASDEARALLGRYWNDGEGEWDNIGKVRDWAARLREFATRMAGADLELGDRLREKWAQLASEQRPGLQRDGVFGKMFLSFRDTLVTFKEERQHIVELLSTDSSADPASANSAGALTTARERTIGWKQGSRRLREWCAWRRARSQGVERKLAAIVAAHEKGNVEAAALRSVFERSYAQWWVATVVGAEPVLSRFHSPEHQRKIGLFRDSDDRYRKLTESIVVSRLSQSAPEATTITLPNSEMGILKREIARKRRHMSIRQLLAKIPNLLPRLKPCLMMSPMSVAQYIDTSHPPFDVVVFDEASQIPVWDAVGAIARGRQAVIVGDPKQLPPTNFFQRSDQDGDDGSNDDVVEDLESILDECMAAQIPPRFLDWHYRSRHESLIAFSNYHYYSNRLLTFPSADLSGAGVYWRHVSGGVYDKGKSRTNRIEAQAVVEEVLRRLRNPELSRHTIGVVTFSQAQQTLIEDLLDAERSRDPSLEPYFAEDALEPLFVKNLENVQGDERDVILFSICFGPDSVGRISMNFGPMNRDGGERRLNVAITRARREVGVFSTLRSEQIDLARSRARGVQDLKWFLEYAERGPSALAAAVDVSDDRDFDSPFEERVYDALVARGWQVRKQVGCASYRIDLAILDPANPGRFLLGIECDGANYHRAKVARDRDKLREEILRGLGWELHRIWSTDWWTDPDREISKLEAALERAKAPKVSLKEQPGSSGRPTPSVATSIGAPKHIPAESARRLPTYRPRPVGRSQGSQSDFYESAAASRIASLITELVKHQSPISLSLAAKWVSSHWGFERVRANVVERVRSLVPSREVTLQTSDSGEFLWEHTSTPGQYHGLRISDGTDQTYRELEDLPLEEIANGALHVLGGAVSAPVDDIVRETARLFGFLRVGSMVEARMLRAIDLIVSRQMARRDGGNVCLVD